MDNNDSKVRREEHNTNSGLSKTSLLKRAFMFLEDGDFSNADSYCERALDIDPENAQAYLGKLMAELHVCKQEALADCVEPFDNSSNYLKVLRFGDEETINTLKNYISIINERKTANIYARAVNAMNNAASETAFRSAAALFQTIPDYKDAGALVKQCIEQAEVMRLDNQNKAAAIQASKKRKIVTCGVVGVIVIAVFILFINPNLKLNKAKNLIKSGHYEEAYLLLDGLNYKDSNELQMSITSQYQSALSVKRQAALAKTLSSARVGSYITFGSYEQDNNIQNGKERIEWEVLEKTRSSILVISRYALDSKVYGSTKSDVSWANSSLRKWLNDTFITEAFSEVEQAMIPTVTISVDKSTMFGPKQDTSVQDQVFLLSESEANKYFSSNSYRRCTATAFANQKLLLNNTNGGTWWWLRSAALETDHASVVLADGSTNRAGLRASTNCAVRPALWINIDY